MEGSADESYKRVFNERQFTGYSKEKVTQFEGAVTNALPKLREALHAEQVGVCVFGSAAIGLATGEINAGERVIPQSDIDSVVIYNGLRKSPVTNLDSLMYGLGNNRYEIEELLKSSSPEASVIGSIQDDALYKVLDSIRDGNIESYATSTSHRFFLFTLVNLLTSKNVGDADFINQVKTNIVSQLQGFGEQGEKIWGQMGRIFKEEYVNYGQPNEFEPIQWKRQQRHTEAVEQVFEERQIPQSRRDAAVSVLNSQRAKIQLPPLSQATVLLR